ncbi:MAG: tetratricopeptide repeat protein [Bacteroidia bacterium]|nr:tetratricopeptide repeat protein [Bacteroidia bacterium]
MKKIKIYNFFYLFAGILIFSCTNNPNDPIIISRDGATTATISESLWLNHNDTVKYVGKETCKTCHQDLYNSFMQTGMGHSFDLPEKHELLKTVAMKIVYDKFKDFYYQPIYLNGNFFMKEFRLKGRDTIYQRLEKTDYVIGHGLQTLSFLQNTNGYLNEMPLTYYTQINKWDLSPGFENGNNTRFSRKIGIECMACHNAYPEFENGSENKYNSVPMGIDCERCHGPGQAHVFERMNNAPLDTSKVVDYSIVNPAKLSVDLQIDVCQRCHLHGNTILKDNKSFFDFKPGKLLKDYITIFHAKYEGESEIKFVSHAERLKMSKCFIVSNKEIENSKDLRPFKNGMTCVTCHNPHVSVQKTSNEIFNNACKNCHGKKVNVLCSEKEAVRKKVNDNCVSCHMPKIESDDIVHGSIHEHFISKKTKISKEQEKKIKTFVGMICLNDKNVSEIHRAKAFINEYDKFSQKTFYLDSAEKILMKGYPKSLETNFELLVQLNFDRGNYKKIYDLVQVSGSGRLLTEKLIKKEESNSNAWTSYRIGEAFYNIGDKKKAEAFFNNAVILAPFNPEFKNKLALSYFANSKPAEARTLFMNALIEHPQYVPALTNLGYLCIAEGNKKEAEEIYARALKIDPDYAPLLLNIAGLRLAQDRADEAVTILLIVLEKDASNKQATEIILNLAKYKANAGEMEDANKIVKRLLTKFPNDKKAKELLKELSLKKNGKGK